MKGKFATILLVLAIPGLALTAAERKTKYAKAAKPAIDLNEGSGVTSSKPSQPANQIAGAPVLIGKTWNAYAPQQPYTNLIAYDPISNLIAVIKRTDRTGAGSGRIVYQISDDGGSNWSAQIGPVNFAVSGTNLNAGRHPNILLSNPTKATDPLSNIVVFAYNDLTRNGNAFGEVVFGADPFTGDQTQFFSKGTDNTDSFGNAGATDLNTGDCYFSIAAVTANPYDVIKISNGGTTLGTPVNVVPDLIGTSGGGAAIDVGNNGTVYHVVRDTWTDAPNGDDSTFAYRLNWSTDGGATWQGPEFVFPYAAAGFSASNYEFDMIVDGNNQVHIAALLVDTTATPSPIDGSVVTLVDLVRTAPNTWSATSIARVRAQVFNTIPMDVGGALLQQLNEPEFAKTRQGQDLALKFIDVIANPVTPADSVNPDIYVAGWRAGTGWGVVTNVSQSPGIAEGFSNLAGHMSDTGDLAMFYTTSSAGDLSESNFWFLPANVVTGVAEKPVNIPDGFALEQNYPNPFNPSTTIKFSLTARVNVKLEVLNMLGQKLETLINRRMDAGTHEIQFAPSQNLPSGVYFYRLEAGNNVTMKKMALMK